MKSTGIRDAKARLSYWLAAAQRDHLVITRHGRPVALVIGLLGRDLQALLSAVGAPPLRALRHQTKRAG